MRLPNKPDSISDDDWQRLSTAYCSDGMVAAHVDMWRLRQWSLEYALLQLALEQTKRASELRAIGVRAIEGETLPVVAVPGAPLAACRSSRPEAVRG